MPFSMKLQLRCWSPPYDTARLDTAPEFEFVFSVFASGVVVKHAHEAMTDPMSIPNSGKISRTDLALAFISGLLLTAAFPKWDWEAFAWIALVPLFGSIRNRSGAAAFKLGMVAGATHYITLLYWITGVMETYGGLPTALSWSVLFLFVFYLSLYRGLFCALMAGIRKRTPRLIWTTPLLWVGLEYLRSVLLSGFPWENLGYSQYNLLPLIQISDIFGVYGLSALIVATNLVIFEIWDACRLKGTVPWKALLVVICLLLGCFIYGKWRLQSTDRQIEAAPKRHVALIQGNIDQSRKWDPSFQQETLTRYERLTFQVLPEKPDLVIWPETALPFYLFEDAELTHQALRIVRAFGSHFLVGSPTFSAEDGAAAYFNSAYLLDPEGRILGRYDKVHLVPYGEYVPLKGLLPFLGKMVDAVGDFAPGTKGRVLSMPSGDLGVLICFEIIFPELARAMAANGAHFLVNLTNDAWFGASSAPYQHFSMAVFRAVETRRAVARTANTGISAIIDPTGRIRERTPLFQEAVRTAQLPIMNQDTAYMRYGYLFERFCLGLLCLCIGWCLWDTRRKRSTD